MPHSPLMLSSRSCLTSSQAAAFPLTDYCYDTTLAVFDTILAQKWASPESSELRVAVWNAGAGVWKGFLDISKEEIESSLQVNVTAAFAFSSSMASLIHDLCSCSDIEAKGRRESLSSR